MKSACKIVAVAAVVAATFGMAAPRPAGAAPEPPSVTPGLTSAQSYFFPSGAGFSEATTDLDYCLSDAANVTVTVLNSGNHIVRTIQTGVSEPQTGSSCFYNELQLSWDGTDDQGDVVPDGAYTVHIVATNSGGQSSYDFERDVASTSPGQLTSPTSGATLTGTTGFVFTPATAFTSTFTISDVDVSCIGDAQSASGDGTWRASGDTSTCANGSQQLATSVSFTDPFGVGHNWQGSTTVTLSNAPSITPDTSAQSYFFPSGGGFSDTTTNLNYCLSDEANVTVTVLNSANHVVRTLQTATAEPAIGSCYYDADQLSWDGTDDQGDVVPDGAYTVHIVATNSGGQSSYDFERDVASTSPGQLTSPTSGATLTGTTGFVFTPATAFTSTFTISDVDVSCIGDAQSASGDGTWRASGDTSTCANGSQQLATSVSFTDPFGVGHNWQGSTTVTLSNAPSITPDTSAQSYFFPSGGGFSDTTTNLNYCLSDEANVTVTVLNSANHVVRTLQTATAEPAIGSCYYDADQLSWDGTDDQGDVVPDGAYTVHIVATNSGGQSSYDFERDVASTSPGQLTSPTSGATLTGTTGFVFTPATAFTSTFTISDVDVSCIGDAQSASGDGTWRASGDTSTCANGSQQLATSVSFTDPFGVGHNWQGSTTVTLSNAPSITPDTSAQSYFFPSGGGFSDTTTNLNYCLSDEANVTVTVLNSANHVVRTLQTATAEPAIGSCYYDADQLSWDGTDDQGDVVPDGAYTVHIVATNSGGQSSYDFERDVASGTPGQITTPTTGATLSGLAQLVFTPDPTFGTKFTLSRVDSCLSTGGCATMFDAGPNGTWPTTELTGSLRAGPATLNTTVSFTDPLGNTDTWSDSGIAVSVNTTAVPLQLSATPTAGSAPLPMTLGLTTSDPNGLALTYTVDYGDGGSTDTGTISDPYSPIQLAHTYEKAGTYKIDVVVSDGNGGVAHKTVGIVVSGQSIPLSVTASPTSGPPPLATTFTITATDPNNQPVNYDMAFGDGQADSGVIERALRPRPHLAHVYDGWIVHGWHLGDGCSRGGRQTDPGRHRRGHAPTCGRRRRSSDRRRRPVR